MKEHNQHSRQLDQNESECSYENKTQLFLKDIQNWEL